MREFVKSKVGRVGTGWLWPLVLIALPDCSFHAAPLVGVFPGSPPHNSAIFCDIEKMSAPRHCAGGDELQLGIPLSHAAIAFTTFDTTNIGLDFSPDAKARCGGGPEAIPFEGSFPEGVPVCLNCVAVVGTVYADANAVCRAQCEGLNFPEGADHNDPAVVEFCQSHARVSTNAPVDDCVGGACSPGGMLRADFVDPRRVPEPVLWQDTIFTNATYASEPFGETISTLTRVLVNPQGFVAGAASAQWFTHGDAYVEFTAGETNKSHAAGLSEIPAGCASPCPDLNPGLSDMMFGILLNAGGGVRLVENGVQFGAFDTYSVGERYRVNVTDNNDATNTATITYSRVMKSCVGAACPETVFHTAVAAAHYPLRVDASLDRDAATLTHAKIVRIK